MRSLISCLNAVGVLAAVAWLSACATAPGPPHRVTLEAEAHTAGFERLSIGDPDLPLAAWVRLGPPGADTLTVFIEGDGAAWPRRDRPPTDPTPEHPVAFGLALASTRAPTAYLARPCQYDHPPACTVADWTTERFSDRAVALVGAALDDLLGRTDAVALTLVGFSGGAYLAARLTAERPDVRTLITAAGVLDPAAWTRHHDVSPLPALDQATAARLAVVPQHHLLGERDTVVPPELALAVLDRLGLADTARVLPAFDHACCWVSAWPDLEAGE